MEKYIADIYKASIYDIDYQKLKKRGIKCLIFDLDNTIARVDELKMSSKSRKFLENLKKDFDLYVISNNSKKRVKSYLQDLDIYFVHWSLKPSTRGIRTILKHKDYKKEEMIIIGDQIVTDILSGKRAGIMTALVDPIGLKDLKITSLNRFFERRILKKLADKRLFIKGEYYD